MNPLDEVAQDQELPTFQVFARFRVEAGSAGAAIIVVQQMIREARESASDVLLERQEAAGVFMIVARFVVVSLEAQTAIGGVVASLAQIGPDEVWALSQRSLSRERRAAAIAPSSAAGRRLLTNQ